MEAWPHLSQRSPAQLRRKYSFATCALDPHVPMPHVTAFVDEMNHAAADYQLIVYGGAMHGFTHKTGPKIPGVEYHALTDTRSATAIREFFAELFGPTV